MRYSSRPICRSLSYSLTCANVNPLAIPISVVSVIRVVNRIGSPLRRVRKRMVFIKFLLADGPYSLPTGSKSHLGSLFLTHGFQHRPAYRGSLICVVVLT